MEMPEGWSNLSSKQYSVLVPVEKNLSREIVYALDLMKEMAELLEQYHEYYCEWPDHPVLKKFKEWK